jgi:hypothetical protein
MIVTLIHLVLSASIIAVPDARVETSQVIRLDLFTPRAEYLIGEAVPFVLVARNVSPETVNLAENLVDDTGAEIRIFISTDGHFFQEFYYGYIPRFLQLRRALEPGQEWVYPFRVLYSRLGPEGMELERGARSRPGGLAFPAKGTYFVRCNYTIQLEKRLEKRKVMSLDTEIIKISVNLTEGIDADVFKIIRDNDVLDFLQIGRYKEGREDLVRKLAGVLRTYPRTSYKNTIVHALRQSYANWRLLEPKEQRELHILCGIDDRVDRLFPTDERLDLKIRANLAEAKTIGSILKRLSEESQVPLEAPPAIGRLLYPGEIRADDLRGIMSQIGRDCHASWRSAANGYYLVLKPQ